MSLVKTNARSSSVSLGKYGQIVYSNNGSTGTTTSSNNSWTDTTLTGAITPSATTSKIELYWVGRTNLTMTGTAFVFHMDFKRAISGGATTSQILEAGYDSALSGVFGYDNRSATATMVDDWRPQRTQSYLDSPSTTSAITYTCQFKANAWAGSSGTEGFYANGILVLREVLV